MATPDLGGSRTVVATPWSDPLHRPRLVCYSGHAGETSREHRLREVIWDLSDPSVANGTLTRRLHTDTDTHVVVNPLLVARQSLVADLLAVIAPRSALAATALRRCRHGLARWLLDDPDSKASDGDDVVRRFVTAGVPATSVALVPASDVVPRADLGPVYHNASARERAAASWDLPVDRGWLLHLCTVNSRRDRLAIAALLRRELRYARTAPRPLIVVAGAGTNNRTLRRVAALHGAADDVVLLGDVLEPSTLIAASDAVVLLEDRVSTDTVDLRHIHPSFSPARVTSRLRHRTIILGSGERAQELAAVLADRRSSHEVVGFLSHQPANVDHSLLGSPILGTFDDLFHVVEKEQIQAIVVAREDQHYTFPMETLFDLKTMGLQIVEGKKLLEQVSGRIHIDAIRPIQLIFSDGFRRPRAVVALKRATDAAIGGVGLVVLAPVFAVLGTLIRLDSRGPIFYRQIRIGLNGKPFSIWKFRSMRVDAELVHTPVWASKGDSRVTRVGRLMRTWRLDELPQLINVVRGEMSLVGPRPERPVFVQELREEIPYYDLRHTVRPGITGWAQVRFAYAASKEESYQKLQYDLYYVKNMSLRLDLRIAAETLRVVTRGEGAR
jgi:sugar transferase (PEP-CTERM system associated)